MIIKKSVAALTPAEYKYLYGLNLRENGLMRDELMSARHRNSHKDYCYILKVGGEIRGWALAFKEYRRHFPTVYFYVKRKYRDKKYGSVLMSRVSQDYPRIRVKPWSKDSGQFFSKFDNVVYDKSDKYWVRKWKSKAA